MRYTEGFSPVVPGNSTVHDNYLRNLTAAVFLLPIVQYSLMAVHPPACDPKGVVGTTGTMDLTEVTIRLSFTTEGRCPKLLPSVL